MCRLINQKLQRTKTLFKRLVDVVKEYEDGIRNDLYPDFPRDQNDEFIRGQDVAEIVAGHVEYILRPKLKQLLAEDLVITRQSGHSDVIAPSYIFQRTEMNVTSVFDACDHVCFGSGIVGSGTNPKKSLELFGTLMGAEILVDVADLDLAPDLFDTRDRIANRNCELIQTKLPIELSKILTEPTLPRIRSAHFKQMAIKIAGLKVEQALSIWNASAKDKKFKELRLSRPSPETEPTAKLVSLA